MFAKLEYLNPSGSVKARIARYMIERAEAEGLLQPGFTIVEASSGNTGNAMSMVAAAKGYRMLVVMPAGMSPERAAISRAHGADVMLIGDFHVNAALDHARTLGERPGYFNPAQFDSQWNVDENEEWLGAEILAPAAAAARRAGGRYRHRRHADRRGPGVPRGQPRASRSSASSPTSRAPSSAARSPRTPSRASPTGSCPASSSATATRWTPTCRSRAPSRWPRCAGSRREHGLFVGPSSGAHMVAAKLLREQRPELETVVTLLCDEGEKYITDHYV